MLLQAQNITFGYSNIPLFENASFSINEGDRIGLVGDNGTGKSTLLKCLMGIEEVHSGQIVRSRALGKIAYVSQSLPENLQNKTFRNFLLEAIPAEERDYSEWKVDVAMDEMGVIEEIREFPLAHLSGGWQRIALLLKANLDEPDLILLDEPTNYLDLDKIFKFENWLNNVVKAPFLAVSHDRRFLDNCTNRTIHIRAGQLIFHNIPYSRAKEELINEDLAKAKARNMEEDEIAKLRAAAKRIRIWSAGRSPKLDRKATVLFDKVERLEDNKTEVYKAPKREIAFNPDEAKPKVLLRVQNAQIKAPDGRLLFKIPEMNVLRGERVAILAMNGIGKTKMMETLVRAYTDPVNNSATNEKIQFNPQVNLGYLDQMVSMLPMERSLSDFITGLGKTTQEATKLLVVAGFPYKNHTQKIKTLSQGERARLAFLGLRVARHNFFIMDEPTNHIDIDGQEKFEDAVITEGHTCIFVSHDRYMMEQVANKYYQVKNGVLKQVDSVEPFYEEMRAIKDMCIQSATNGVKTK